MPQRPDLGSLTPNAELATATEKMQRRMRRYRRQLRLGHVGKARQVQLMRDGDGLGWAVTVLAEDQIRLTAARVVPLERIRPVQQDDHVRVLFERIM